MVHFLYRDVCPGDDVGFLLIAVVVWVIILGVGVRHHRVQKLGPLWGCGVHGAGDLDGHPIVGSQGTQGPYVVCTRVWLGTSAFEVEPGGVSLGHYHVLRIAGSTVGDNDSVGDPLPCHYWVRIVRFLNRDVSPGNDVGGLAGTVVVAVGVVYGRIPDFNRVHQGRTFGQGLIHRDGNPTAHRAPSREFRHLPFPVRVPPYPIAVVLHVGYPIGEGIPDLHIVGITGAVVSDGDSVSEPVSGDHRVRVVGLLNPHIGFGIAGGILGVLVVALVRIVGIGVHLHNVHKGGLVSPGVHGPHQGDDQGIARPQSAHMPLPAVVVGAIWGWGGALGVEVLVVVVHHYDVTGIGGAVVGHGDGVGQLGACDHRVGVVNLFHGHIGLDLHLVGAGIIIVRSVRVCDRGGHRGGVGKRGHPGGHIRVDLDDRRVPGRQRPQVGRAGPRPLVYPIQRPAGIRKPHRKRITHHHLPGIAGPLVLHHDGVDELVVYPGSHLVTLLGDLQVGFDAQGVGVGALHRVPIYVHTAGGGGVHKRVRCPHRDGVVNLVNPGLSGFQHPVPIVPAHVGGRSPQGVGDREVVDGGAVTIDKVVAHRNGVGDRVPLGGMGRSGFIHQERRLVVHRLDGDGYHRGVAVCSPTVPGIAQPVGEPVCPTPIGIRGVGEGAVLVQGEGAVVHAVGHREGAEPLPVEIVVSPHPGGSDGQCSVLVCGVGIVPSRGGIVHPIHRDGDSGGVTIPIDVT